MHPITLTLGAPLLINRDTTTYLARVVSESSTNALQGMQVMNDIAVTIA